MSTQTSPLEKAIRECGFLPPDQRETLLRRLPDLSEDARARLAALLEEAPGPADASVPGVIARAARDGDAAFFEAIDAVLAVESRAILAAERNADHAERMRSLGEKTDSSSRL